MSIRSTKSEKRSLPSDTEESDYEEAEYEEAEYEQDMLGTAPTPTPTPTIITPTVHPWICPQHLFVFKPIAVPISFVIGLFVGFLCGKF